MRKKGSLILILVTCLLLLVSCTKTKETPPINDTILLVSRSEVIDIATTLLCVHNQTSYTDAVNTLNCSNTFKDKYWGYVNNIYPYNLDKPSVSVEYCGAEYSTESNQVNSYFIIAKLSYSTNSTTVRLRLDFNNKQLCDFERF